MHDGSDVCDGSDVRDGSDMHGLLRSSGVNSLSKDACDVKRSFVGVVSSSLSELSFTSVCCRFIVGEFNPACDVISCMTSFNRTSSVLLVSGCNVSVVA